MLQARAGLLTKIRAYFAQAGVLEVTTPTCSRHANTDPALENFQVTYTGPGAPVGQPFYLHTSPEFHMKRLLAAGSGSIYQTCQVFRDGECGRQHNPEFSLLEWYRLGFDHHRLMADVAALVNGVLPEPRLVERHSYGDIFQHHLGVNPHDSTASALQACAVEQGIVGADRLDLPSRDAWLDLLLIHCIEPQLGRQKLSFIYDYPASQSSLARVRQDDTPVAERFELYMNGMELANGFHELTDSAEQRRRFEQDLIQREAAGQKPVPMDENLLAALAAGLPDCAGVALGIDRLLMQITGAKRIDDVLAFPLGRA
ncbi:Translation elongation factor P Lys34--(R)-beta-lysine ligase [hydrothermal vent metagenome]|uniref:Translation elongation factor P Lys34--(R)-beta-lysine ligase n=1 Tax=hydrothermal vent metagenome TaxID=652676 RepID=A0A3B1BAK2_9ZZZZ